VEGGVVGLGVACCARSCWGVVEGAFHGWHAGCLGIALGGVGGSDDRASLHRLQRILPITASVGYMCLDVAFGESRCARPLMQKTHTDVPMNTTSTPSHPYVPGEPSVSLAPDEVHDFLVRELNTPILDELYTRLWLVARKSGDYTL